MHNPAMVAVRTAQSTRKKIISSVFLYNSRKFIFLITSLNASVLHSFGKMTNGFTLVASVTVLNAVKIIHKNGTNIVIDTRIIMTWIRTLITVCFVFMLSILLPPS